MKILITGGSKGLGSAIVRQLLNDPDSQVYFTYYKSIDQAGEITNSNQNATAIYCDFNDRNSVEALADRLEELDIDMLVNNATVPFPKSHFYKSDPNLFLESFKINVLNTILITQSAIKIFRKKKQGRIITILSSAIMNKPPVGWAEYVANKNYLLSLSKSWATENIRYNISSNCVSPSFMLTDYNSDIDERVVEDMIKNHPLKKLLTVDEVASTVLFLITCSLHINGINISMNAGTDI